MQVHVLFDKNFLFEWFILTYSYYFIFDRISGVLVSFD